MDGPYDGAEGIQRPTVGNGSIRFFDITVSEQSDRRKGPAGEVVRPGRRECIVSPTKGAEVVVPSL